MDIELFATPGLGDTSYLVASDGEAALVDPQRDVWRFLEVADARGWRITHVLETHVHNDYLSGALETRAVNGATIVAPARGGYAFAHRGADEGTEVRLGNLRLTALATPGHTPEHLAWAVGAAAAAADSAPDAVFTGGSLLVGTAGRTDLLGDDRTGELTRLQAISLRRLAALPPAVRILPTHGRGSFCAAGQAAGPLTTSVGAEQSANAVLEAAGGLLFSDVLLNDLGRYPTYYAQMAPLNRAGPTVLGRPAAPPAHDVAGFERVAVHGARIVDARPREAFATAHIPGSLNIELDESFASYVGWLVPFDAPILLVLPSPVGEAVMEAVTQLLRIGYDHVDGILAGGLEAWAASGRKTRSYATTSIEQVFDAAARGDRTELLDVREPVEWREGVIPWARTIFVADLTARLGELPRDRPLTVLCKAGSRAAIAASILDAADIPVRLVASGGATGWTDRFAALPPAPALSPAPASPAAPALSPAPASPAAPATTHS
ncbi:MAG: MBL fold metallo-hydrolase [Chloroflexi bacterium]|nr:MBL fold metallo-hydrolase [Chloroflexota bacterium]